MPKKINHSKINLYDFFFANKARRTYTNLGFSLLLIIVFLFFALRPTILTIGTIQEKTKEYKELNSLVEQKLSAKRTLKEQLTQTSSDSPNGLKSEIDFMNDVFTDSYAFKDLYNNILDRANKTNVALKTITPQYQATRSSITDFDASKRSPSNRFYEINIVIEAKSMTDVELFIKNIETYSRFPIFSRLKSMTINNEIEAAKLLNRTGSANNIINVNIGMVIYLDSTRLENNTPKNK